MTFSPASGELARDVAANVAAAAGDEDVLYAFDIHCLPSCAPCSGNLEVSPCFAKVL